MQTDTRLAPHVEFHGDFSRHFGLFEGCGGGLPFERGGGAGEADAACS